MQSMNNKMNWLVRVILLWLTFVFQVTFISASPVNLGFNPHNPVSETCIDDENENSNRVIDDHNGRVNWAIFKSEAGSDCEDLLSLSRSGTFPSDDYPQASGRHNDKLNKKTAPHDVTLSPCPSYEKPTQIIPTFLP